MLHDGWAVVCQVGLWGWIVFTVVFIVRSFPRRGSFRRDLAFRWGGAVISFFILWIAGMLLA
ncbi:MAG: hypothetical protein ED859_09355 [Desulfuromonadales bacterium]|nr:MAG: hypothetical protein ED859_09355 [Desulfuromonadales bacterium]